MTMMLDEYQELAAGTEGPGIAQGGDLSILLLGLAGESGSVLTLYKKWLRDGDSFQILEDRISEELGDVLWYLAAIARHRGLSLGSIAEANLKKTSARWLQSEQRCLFDDDSDKSEQLPRTFTAELTDVDDVTGRRLMRMTLDGEAVGAALADNSYMEDGYRFHDLFHLSLAATMGWSPVIRALLHRKRKSEPFLEEVEDGGRAIAIEEGISALVFSYASQHSLLAGVKTIDWSLLQTCSNMTMGLEVRKRQLFDWEQCILRAYDAWRVALRDGGVRVYGDLIKQEFRFEPLRHLS